MFPLTPRNLLIRLSAPLRRSLAFTADLLSRLPVLSGFSRRLLLTEEVSLRDVAGGPLHGVSTLILEATPGPVHFPSARYDHVISHSGSYLDGDPYRLDGYPNADPAAVFYGGLARVREPSAGMLYVRPQRYHCTLHEPFLNLHHGALCTAAGPVVTDCAARNRSGKLTRTWLRGRLRPRRTERLPGRFTTIWGKFAGSNHYHWLIECLPRLRQLADLGEPPPILLMPRSMPAVCEESLACCLPANMPMRRMDGWVRPEDYVFVSFRHIKPAAWLDEDSRRFVRDAVFRRYGLSADHKGTRRIYLSRSAAALRRLVNEDEVQEVLAGFGFETVWAERLTFEQQVRVFHGASHVVTVHGAGLANLLFAGPVGVLELFARGTFTPLYFFLATSLGQRHHFLLGSEESRLQNFRIDVDELRAAVGNLLADDGARHEWCEARISPT